MLHQNMRGREPGFETHFAWGQCLRRLKSEIHLNFTLENERQRAQARPKTWRRSLIGTSRVTRDHLYCAANVLLLADELSWKLHQDVW